MAGEIQLNSTTMATESSGSITAQLDTIRPNTTNGSLTLQGDSSDAGVTGLTIDSSGNATFAQTISGGTIGSGVVFPAGTVKNATVLEFSSRTVVSASSSSDVELFSFGNYNKLNANTDLIISVFIPVFTANLTGGGKLGFKYGAGTTVFGNSTFSYGSPYTCFICGSIKISGHTTTGSQSLSYRYGNAQGLSQKVCNVICYNGTDDANSDQTKATAIILEVN